MSAKQDDESDYPNPCGVVIGQQKGPGPGLFISCDHERPCPDHPMTESGAAKDNPLVTFHLKFAAQELRAARNRADLGSSPPQIDLALQTAQAHALLAIAEALTELSNTIKDHR